MRHEPATVFFSCTPGGAVQMANMAQHNGGAPGKTGLARTMRVVTVVLLFSVAVDAAGRDGSPAVPAVVSFPGLAVLMWVAVLWGFLARRLKLLNPFFLGPMIAGGILTASGTHLPACRRR